jgi:hypothetical protein
MKLNIHCVSGEPQSWTLNWWCFHFGYFSAFESCCSAFFTCGHSSSTRVHSSSARGHSSSTRGHSCFTRGHSSSTWVTRVLLVVTRLLLVVTRVLLVVTRLLLGSLVFYSWSFVVNLCCHYVLIQSVKLPIWSLVIIEIYIPLFSLLSFKMVNRKVVTFVC